MVKAIRGQAGQPTVTIEMLDAQGLTSRDVSITSYDGQSIEMSIVQPKGRSGKGPAIFHTHGGGMVFGDRWLGVASSLQAALRHNAVVVTVEYRLAPEFPDPTPIEDCYAGLVWIA